MVCLSEKINLARVKVIGNDLHELDLSGLNLPKEPDEISPNLLTWTFLNFRDAERTFYTMCVALRKDRFRVIFDSE